MGILDEIEGHATQASRLQARSGNAAREAYLYEYFAEKSAGKLLTIGAVSAFIPFVGWTITMWCWLFSNDYLATLNARKAGTDAATVALLWGIFTTVLPWITFDIGFHAAEGDEMMIFYIIATVVVYKTFRVRQTAVTIAKATREVADHIASQG